MKFIQKVSNRNSIEQLCGIARNCAELQAAMRNCAQLCEIACNCSRIVRNCAYLLGIAGMHLAYIAKKCKLDHHQKMISLFQSITNFKSVQFFLKGSVISSDPPCKVAMPDSQRYTLKLCLIKYVLY